MESKALEANIKEYGVDVEIDPKYKAIQELMSGYYGLQECLANYLKELSHPYKNWKYIVDETRVYSLDKFHMMIESPKGAEVAALFLEISCEALAENNKSDILDHAVNNIMLFCQKMIRDSSDSLETFLPVLERAFRFIAECDMDIFIRFARGFYRLNRIAGSFIENAPLNTNKEWLIKSLIRFYDYTYSYWLDLPDPLLWFNNEIGHDIPDEKLSDLFQFVKHESIRQYMSELNDIKDAADSASVENIERLLSLPGYLNITSAYDALPSGLFRLHEEKSMGNRCKIVFLFHIMNIEGLSSIHEDTLREINRTLKWFVENEDIYKNMGLIEKTFTILHSSVKKFPDTTLNCLSGIGNGVYKTDESDLVDFFIENILTLGFQPPDFAGVTDEWQIQVNTSHLKNIRTWMETISLKPKWSKRLISSLIINISLSGLYIKDTDLFPRDITKLLNSDIEPVYNLIKQLVRLFPVYFNEIGAEGELRDISTRIDEINKREDRLIHFLRKQCHVEGSNKIISFIEAVLQFWITKSKEGLDSFLPPNIYDDIDEKGRYVDGVHKIFDCLYKQHGSSTPSDLCFLTDNDIKECYHAFPDIAEAEKERAALILKLYKLLDHKYNISFSEIDEYLAGLQSSAFPDLYSLRQVIASATLETEEKLSSILDYLDNLMKKILSEEKFEIQEDIYRKRHISVNIPSMYGTYHEVKFDALGLTLRLETLVNALFEELIEDMDIHLITRSTFFQIHRFLTLFNRALNLDGISSREFEQQLNLLSHSLDIGGFTFTQYLDIFRGFSEAVHNIVNDYYTNIHIENLTTILADIPEERLPGKYKQDMVLYTENGNNRETFIHKVSEIFLRDRIASALGLQRLDLFITRILNTLNREADELPDESLQQILTYDPKRALTNITAPDPVVSNIINMGNKGLNLTRLQMLGIQIPPGFIVTTEIFRNRNLIEDYLPAQKNFRARVEQQLSVLEKQTGSLFGSPDNPLLLSVRSGSAFSQPGMLDTYLNVGINEEIVEVIASKTGKKWFAWDSYRRFLQSYGMSFGIKRDDFDSVIADFKERYDVPRKRNLKGNQMKEVALAYKELIRSKDIAIEDSPLEQLYIAIKMVLNSWNSPKAAAYRRIMGISDDWGTAVTVQRMIFGNISNRCGSGVFFTHNPKLPGDTLWLWGDYATWDQGEDLVSGLINTLPISMKQAEIENRTAEPTLEYTFPDIYNALRDVAKKLIYEERWPPQDMEFTFEGPTAKELFFLQTRDMDIRERKITRAFEITPEMSSRLLGHGIGVSGGVMSGRVVFTGEEILHWRKKEPSTLLILVRIDTVPDDIQEISEADGLLTSRGGSTSHASIVANRLGKICVVGCADLLCIEKEKKFLLNRKEIRSGDFIGIDGIDGAIYEGKI